jgi:hypothetical protein
MRALLGAVVAVLTVGVPLAGVAGTQEGAPPHAIPDEVCRHWNDPAATGPAPGGDWDDEDLADHCLRLNQTQVLGTHNSYHLRPEEPLWSTLLAFDESFRDWSYRHSPIPNQLAREGIRQIELDVYADPEGGRWADRRVMALLGLPTASGVPELDEPGYKVIHVHELDFRTTCYTLVQCLEQVRGWSDEHPRHLPIAVLIELKDDPIPDPVDAGFVQPIPIGPELLDDLDAEIRSVFPPEQVITPDDVRVEGMTLEESVLTSGWPRLGDARGKVMFLMDNAGPKRADYVAGRPNLEGRVLFTNATPGDPDAAFVKRNDPTGANQAQIQELVEAGYVVRTYPPFGEEGFQAALDSGAHWISTDYPVPERAAWRDSDFVATIPGGDPARCNPLVTGPGCRDAALEFVEPPPVRCPEPPPHGFTDVAPGSLAEEHLGWLRCVGITRGSGAGQTFSPHRQVTRAELAVLLWRTAGEPDPGERRFDDVPADAWFADAVAWAGSAGVTTGTAGGTRFAPHQQVTRAQAAALLWRFAGQPDARGVHGFTDVAADAFFGTAVSWLAEHGITVGTGPATFAPHRTLTRAQAGALLFRLAGAPAAWGPVAIPPTARF